MDDVRFAGYVPGAIGRVAELHGTYYHEHWRFGLFLEARVAKELSEFLNRSDDDRDGFWTASLQDRLHGSIAIDGVAAETDGAHLRWFILSPEVRGRGLGNQLMERAVSFCREKYYGHVYLWTFQGLDAARHLYEKFGFRLAWQGEGTQWGKKIVEQKFELDLG
jgi:GNAT superfamily N-acetyltransferase